MEHSLEHWNIALNSLHMSQAMETHWPVQSIELNHWHPFCWFWLQEIGWLLCSRPKSLSIHRPHSSWHHHQDHQHHWSSPPSVSNLWAIFGKMTSWRSPPGDLDLVPSSGNPWKMNKMSQITVGTAASAEICAPHLPGFPSHLCWPHLSNAKQWETVVRAYLALNEDITDWKPRSLAVCYFCLGPYCTHLFLSSGCGGGLVEAPWWKGHRAQSCFDQNPKSWLVTRT